MDYDVIVLGSGPGGYVTAIRLTVRFETAVVEKESLMVFALIGDVYQQRPY